MKIGKLNVDKAGRIVLPKKVRELFKLREGEALEVHLEGLRLIIQPVSRSGLLVKQDGILVFQGGEPFGDEDLSQRDREERIQSLLSDATKSA